MFLEAAVGCIWELEGLVIGKGQVRAAMCVLCVACAAERWWRVGCVSFLHAFSCWRHGIAHVLIDKCGFGR